MPNDPKGCCEGISISYKARWPKYIKKNLKWLIMRHEGKFCHLGSANVALLCWGCFLISHAPPYAHPPAAPVWPRLASRPYRSPPNFWAAAPQLRTRELALRRLLRSGIRPPEGKHSHPHSSLYFPSANQVAREVIILQAIPDISLDWTSSEIEPAAS